MATKEVIVSDIDGTSPATSRFIHNLSGHTYKIDLSPEEDAEFTKKFSELMDPYLEAGQRVSRRTAPSRSASRRHDLAAVRQWARENGYEVSDRGRISQQIIEDYETATGTRA